MHLRHNKHTNIFTMESLYYYANKMQHVCTKTWHSTRFFVCSCLRNLLLTVTCCYRDLLRLNPLLVHIIYFLFLSFLGFAILKSLNPRTNFKPRNIDVFFTSVSASTVSSMSTVEMEIFSNSQLIVITILMLIGGEIFTSMLGLHFKRSKIIRTWKSEAKVESVESDISSFSSSPPRTSFDEHDHDIEMVDVVIVTETGVVSRFQSQKDIFASFKPFIKYDSIKFLGFLVLGYFLIIQILGVSSVLIYLSFASNARDVLKNKGIKVSTFAIFTVVSTFASCGFVPTNENMMVFSKNSGLLMILIPQILLGNTLFPSCLRFLIWGLGKITNYKKEECEYLLKNTSQVGYKHLLPRLHSLYLVGTVFGFILIGFVMFCGLEWDSQGLSGLNSYEKVVGVVFESVNARHTGETIVDLSTIAPAILVFFVVMMYLPPYTSFIPIKKDDQENLEELEGRRKKRQKRFAENLVFSQLSYLAIFIILICITERKNLRRDPVNFNVMNITFEVISAYGNVGFTTGYSCERRVSPDPDCVNKWYGFSGKWSDEGKLVLIVVMFFGRLKKFNMNGGQAWELL